MSGDAAITAAHGWIACWSVQWSQSTDNQREYKVLELWRKIYLPPSATLSRRSH